MTRMRLCVHVLLLTVAFLMSATIGGKVDAAQAVNGGEIVSTTFAQAKLAPTQESRGVIVRAAQPSEWLSGTRGMWENLTWDILMWNGYARDSRILENFTRDIFRWECAGQHSNADWVSIVNLD